MFRMNFDNYIKGSEFIMRFNLTDFDHGCFVGEKIVQLYLKHGGKHPLIVKSKQEKKDFFFNEVYAELKPMIEKHQISEITQKRIARMTYKSAFEQYERLTEEQKERFYDMLWNDLEIKAGQLNNYALLGYDIQDIEKEEAGGYIEPLAGGQSRIVKPEKLKHVHVVEQWTDEKGRINYKAKDGEIYLVIHNELFKLNEEGTPVFEVKNWDINF